MRPTFIRPGARPLASGTNILLAVNCQGCDLGVRN